MVQQLYCVEYINNDIDARCYEIYNYKNCSFPGF